MKEKSHHKLDFSHIEVLSDEMADIYRGMTPEQKIAIALKANETFRQEMYAYLQKRHPDWNVHAIKAEVARRMLELAGRD